MEALRTALLREPAAGKRRELLKKDGRENVASMTWQLGERPKENARMAPCGRVPSRPWDLRALLLAAPR